jgi:hypothetical protein
VDNLNRLADDGNASKQESYTLARVSRIGPKPHDESILRAVCRVLVMSDRDRRHMLRSVEAILSNSWLLVPMSILL